ncbi:MAG: DEAD/DEAH box helicase [Streptococcaceae bacterium]|nr:DEAD/DEAH box helicase [Streptococcaceae bacterium]MCL2681019.1 DEAD/DEAH box helicase [Streptococcaceae bacterium]MCL2858658.1 DEAD/DEAH box helicase [Streptococcaceae bacterium]
MKENLYGRLLTKNEISEIDREVKRLESMTELSHTKIQCNRCGTIHIKVQVSLPIGVYYCPSCITMQRVRSDQPLYHLPQKSFSALSAIQWQGQLTPYQEQISKELLKAVEQREQILVHAVTGAGKTEMIYQSIDKALSSGGAVGIASPRIDVCIELHGRLSRDFDCSIPLLHGEGEAFFRSPLVICTTHQLLRFKEYFDLLIIDEVDAFPFVDNTMLYHGVEQARKMDSTLIYLTATSTRELNNKVKKGQLRKVHLPRRFHGNPLVVPQTLWHTKFKEEIKKQRKSSFPLLIFAPEIEFGKAFTEKLKKEFPHEKIDFVASTTENRLDIVQQFRQKKLTILVSTTILERGVTFPMVDVFVIDAHHHNFTSSALIQIAGRAGRSPERPTGLVHFFHQGKNTAILTAISEIKKMNKLGGLQ